MNDFLALIFLKYGVFCILWIIGWMVFYIYPYSVSPKQLIFGIPVGWLVLGPLFPLILLLFGLLLYFLFFVWE